MIAIVPYKPSWPNEFLEKGTMLRRLLGDLALRIDHIGSTAVPGLAAKDVIDIQITADRLTDKLERAMNLAGFQRLVNINQDHVPPAIAQAYGQVKEAIVKYHPEQDMEAYYDIKDPVCDIIMGGAEEWAAFTKWQPDHTDC